MTTDEHNETLSDALMRIRYQKQILNDRNALKDWVDRLIPFGEQAQPHAAEVLSQLRSREKWLMDYPEMFEPLGQLAASSGHTELISFLKDRAKAGKPLGVYHIFKATPCAELERILIQELERLGTREYGVSHGLDRGMILFALSGFGSEESLKFLNVLEKDLVSAIASEWEALKRIMTPAELRDLDEIMDDGELMMWGPGGGWRGEQLSTFQHICRLGGFHGDVENYREELRKRLEAEKKEACE